MSKIVFIRHARKEFDNNKGPPGCYQHDPDIYPIDESKLEKICTRAKFNYIISSPYKRALNTSKYIRDYLASKKNKTVDIIIDPNIGEYLGNQRPYGKKANLDPTTRKYIDPTLGTEKISEIIERIEKSFKMIKQLNTDIIVVTHGINIQMLWKNLDKKHKYRKINSLSGLVYQGESVKPFLI